MAINTNRKTQAPFQPMLSEGSVATSVDKGFVQEGVVDKSTGNLISAVGETGLNAYEGYQVAGTERKIKENIEAFTGVTTDPEEEKMNTKLSRLVNGRVNGGMSELEFRVRIENAVKEGIATMPGRATVFRKAAAEILGDNDAAIDYTIQQQKAATKANNKYMDAMVAHFKVPKHVLAGPEAPKYQRAYAALGEAQHQFEMSTAVEGAENLDRDGKVRRIAFGANAHAQIKAHEARAALDDIINNDPTASQMLAEGKSRRSVLEKLFSTQQARRDFADKMLDKFTKSKQEMEYYYVQQSTTHGVTLDDLKAEMEAHRKVYDGYISLFSQKDLDADRVAEFGQSLGEMNRASLEIIFAQSQALNMGRGAVAEIMKLYFSDNPGQARDTLGDHAFNTIKNVIDSDGGARFVTSANKIAAGDITADALLEVDPQLARAVNANSVHVISETVEKGFPTKTPFGLPVNTQELKEAFVNHSISVLGTIDVKDKESINTFRKIFGTGYGDRLAELPDRLQKKITRTLTDKYDSVLGTKKDPMTVVGRIFAAEEEHKKARSVELPNTPQGSVPDLEVEVENGELVQKGNISPKGVLEYEWIAPRRIRDHQKAIQDANTFLRARHEAATLFGDKRTWPQYLDDFYQQVYMGVEPEKEETEKIEEGANDTSANSTNYRKLVDAVAGGTVGGK